MPYSIATVAATVVLKGNAGVVLACNLLAHLSKLDTLNLMSTKRDEWLSRDKTLKSLLTHI